MQELPLEVRSASRQLAQRLDHAPGDLAAHLELAEEAVRGARQADQLLKPCSLDAPLAGQPEGPSLAGLLGHEPR
jgi:hypothetical protein